MLNNRQRNVALVIAFFVIAVIVGGTMVTYAFSGLITFLSFVVLLENVKALRYIAYKLDWAFEIGLFILAMYAKFAFGVTLAMSLMVGTILYGMLYHEYLKHVYNQNSKK